MSSFGGPEIRNDNLVLHLDASNAKSYNYNEVSSSEDFSTGDYERSAGLTVLKGFLAPDGSYNASRVTDQLAGSTEYFTRYFTIPNDSQYYELTLYIKKTTGGTSPTTGFDISFSLGSSSFGYAVRLNTDTGTYEAGCITNVSSADNDYWKLACYFANNSTGNTLLQIKYYPARNVYGGGFPDVVTVTGSQIIWGLQLIYARSGQLGILPYKPNYSVVGSVSRTITGNAWKDLSGNGNNGTLINYASPSYSNNAMVFDGTSQNTAVTDNASINAGLGDCSVDVWCKSNSLYNDAISHRVVAKGAGSDVDPGWCIVANNGYIFASVCASTTRVGPTGANFAINEWLHFTLVISRSAGITTYKNGVATGNVAVGAGTLTNGSNLTIGGLGGSNWFGGSISDVKVYNTALSAEQVLQNFNALRGRYGV